MSTGPEQSAGPSAARSLPESQPERTRLAWRRTSLALIASALLSIALVARRQATVAAIVVLLVDLAVIAAAMSATGRRIRALDRTGFGRPGRSLSVFTVLVVTTGALGALLVILSG